MKKLSFRNSISKRKGKYENKKAKKIREVFKEDFNQNLLPEIEKEYKSYYFDGYSQNRHTTKSDASNSILSEALKIVYGDRQEDYGDPVECFQRVSEACRVVWKIEIKPDEVVKVLITLKQVRESYKHKRDNQTDVGGYTDILQMIKDAGLNP